MTEIFYRLGSVGEKSLFKDMKKYYDGIIIGAHLLSLYSSSIPVFIQELEKPFLIDPMTYVFGRSFDLLTKNDELKKSFKKLIERFEKPISNILKNREFVPSDFLKNGQWNEKLLEKFIKNVLNLQKNIMISSPAQQSILEYMEILGEAKKPLKPKYLIAPYFYFSSTTDPWYLITQEFSKRTEKFKKNEKIYSVICFSKNILLDGKEIKKVIEDYSNIQVDGYLLWISDLDETKDDQKFLEGLVQFVRTLAEKSKKPIYSLYGGYFSLLLSKYGLKGYSRGICYGEAKNVDTPTLGGRTTKRYYFPPIHAKLSERKARTLYQSNPHLLCQCEICKKILNKLRKNKQKTIIEEFFNKLNIEQAKKHFIATHAKEIETITKLSKKEIIKTLKKDIETCEKIQLKEQLGIDHTYLTRWKEILEKY